MESKEELKDALGNVLSVGDQVALSRPDITGSLKIGVITALQCRQGSVCVTFNDAYGPASALRFPQAVVKVFKGGLV